MAVTIIEILGVEGWLSNGKRHYRTHVILEDGDEAKGYGDDYKVGDKVMRWRNDEWDYTQIKKIM